MALSIFVPGIPAPQGSKRHVGRGIMVESSKRVKPWRDDIRAMLIDADGQPKARFDGAVRIDAQFLMPRPKSIRKNNPPHTKRPDLDKLLRALLDAITSAGVIIDDSNVCSIEATKEYVIDRETTGVLVRISEG